MKLHKLDWLWGLGLATAALLIRLPFRSQFLYHWDSVNFALSLEHYDVRLHQPHPPGYFLYSMLGRLVNFVIHDANTSLVWISLLSGVLGVVALYGLGTLMFGRQIGVAAALLALTNPLQWFYSEVALSYALEFLLVIIVAGLCYLQFSGHRLVWLWLAILLGVAGGVRQNDLIFLLPLWLLSLSMLSWRQRVASIGVLGVVVTAWMWPMMALSGGPAAYFAAVRTESSGIASESSLSSLSQLGLNSFRMMIYVGYGLILGIIPLLWGIWSLVRTNSAWFKDRRAWVLVLWIGPAACFYVLVHLRQHGHIFTFLPALILLTALAAVRLGQALGGSGPPQLLTRIVIATLVLANGLFFILAPASLFGSERLPLQTPSRQTIMQRDTFLEERLAYVRSHFDPRSTVILAGGLDFRHLDYYLRDYRLTNLSYSLSPEKQQLPEDIQTLVIFTPGTEQEWQVSGMQPGPQSSQGLLPYFVRAGKQPVYVARANNQEDN